MPRRRASPSEAAHRAGHHRQRAPRWRGGGRRRNDADERAGEIAAWYVEQGFGTLKTKAGADYCGLGPMFPTTTKHKPTLAGPAYLGSYLADPNLSARPHLAIGGITRYCQCAYRGPQTRRANTRDY